MKILTGVIALLLSLTFGAANTAVAAEKIATPAAPAAEKKVDCKDIKDEKEKKKCEDDAMKAKDKK